VLDAVLFDRGDTSTGETLFLPWAPFSGSRA
jgi:hypothetical protein